MARKTLKPKTVEDRLVEIDEQIAAYGLIESEALGNRQSAPAVSARTNICRLITEKDELRRADMAAGCATELERLRVLKTPCAPARRTAIVGRRFRIHGRVRGDHGRLPMAPGERKREEDPESETTHV